MLWIWGSCNFSVGCVILQLSISHLTYPCFRSLQASCIEDPPVITELHVDFSIEDFERPPVGCALNNKNLLNMLT
jgi:hypothetical protein